MDLLKAELERKRKALALTKKTLPANTTASELRRVQELVEHDELEPNRKKNRSSSTSSGSENNYGSRQNPSATATADQERPSIEDSTSIEDSNAESAATRTGFRDKETTIEAKALINGLRSFGLPIRLFAENFSMQKERLAQAQQSAKAKEQDQNDRSEFKLEAGHGIRNTFLDKGKSPDSLSVSKNEEKKRNPSKSVVSDRGQVEPLDDNVKDDPHKWVYRHFKDILKEWEGDIESSVEDPSLIASARRNQIKTFKQCKDYIRPLFKQLQRRTVEPQMLKNLLKIVQHSEAKEFVQAHSAYMDVAIGRAAWPIGVTAVGIHARTGRSKIESNNVAHVMNSELQRKYLTSVKRLLSYRQSKATDVDPSKKVLM